MCSGKPKLGENQYDLFYFNDGGFYFSVTCRMHPYIVSSPLNVINFTQNEKIKTRLYNDIVQDIWFRCIILALAAININIEFRDI